MRTTITIDDNLLDEVRRHAAELNRTVSQVIEDGVRESLMRRRTEPVQRFTVRPVDVGGTLPGVDLDDNAALLDLMENDG